MSGTPAQTEPPPPSSFSQVRATDQRSVPVSSVVTRQAPLPTGNSEEPRKSIASKPCSTRAPEHAFPTKPLRTSFKNPPLSASRWNRPCNSWKATQRNTAAKPQCHRGVYLSSSKHLSLLNLQAVLLLQNQQSCHYSEMHNICSDNSGNCSNRNLFLQNQYH